jgi:hypothetical protein
MPPSDYADDAATEIDREPHWSSRSSTRAATVRPVEPQAFPVVAPEGSPQISRTVTRVSLDVPAAFATPVAFDMRRAPARPVFSQRRPEPVAVRAPLPPPQRPFYSHAEECARQHLVTERVPRLPAPGSSKIWGELLEAAWSRFAAPACGVIAGLIFVVGYLAYSSQRGAGIATSAATVAPIVMPAEVAMTSPTETDGVAPRVVAVDRTPTVASVNPPAEPTRRAKAARVAPRAASADELPARASVSRKPPATKRRPIRLNDSTPLGDLRPSRSR